MSNTIIVNMNNFATVKLTPHGRKIWHDFWGPYSGGKSTMDDKIKPDGRLREQIWHLMQVFGPHAGMGLPPVFVEVVMEIECDPPHHEEPHHE